MSRDFEELTGVELLKGSMLRKLRLNAHKIHWKELPIDLLLRLMKGELSELEEAIDTYRTSTVKSVDSVESILMENILKECADIANFCMMIHDNYVKGYIKYEDRSPEKTS